MDSTLHDSRLLIKGRVPSPDEAHEILIRFCNSHFGNRGEHARASIPADPNRDDDLLMSSFIEWARNNANIVANLSKN